MRSLRAALLIVIVACGSDPMRVETQAARFETTTTTADCSLVPSAIDRPAPDRLVAIGDLHGDFTSARRALRRAGAIDERDRWVGGAMGVVQLGDVLDRGDGERAIIDLFERLEREAAAAGGSFTWLLGNHELMNAAGDFRYVTSGGWQDFDGDRAAALAPGGAYRRIFAEQDVAVRIGEVLFSHAGIAPEWAGDLPAANRDARCWLGAGGTLPLVASDSSGPVWSRAWGGEAVDCASLDRVLDAAGASRMVVAHTPQLEGITSACGGRLWRVDTGMSSHYGGPIQVLEITADTAHPI